MSNQEIIAKPNGQAAVEDYNNSVAMLQKRIPAVQSQIENEKKQHEQKINDLKINSSASSDDLSNLDDMHQKRIDDLNNNVLKMQEHLKNLLDNPVVLHQ